MRPTSQLPGTIRPGHALLSLALLSLLCAVSAYQLPFSYRIEIGKGDTSYLRNFYPFEQGSGAGWRWSKAASQIIFHNAGQILPAGRAMELDLTLFSARPPEMDIPNVEIRVEGKTLPVIEVPRGPTIVRIPIPAQRELGDLSIYLQSETFEPKDDPRPLGVAIQRAILRPSDSQNPITPPLATLLLAACFPPAVFLVIRDLARSRLAFGVGLALAAAVGVGLAGEREQTVLYLPYLCTISVLLALFLLGAQAAQSKRWAEWREDPRLHLLDRGLAFLGAVLLVGGEAVVWLAHDLAPGAILLGLGLLAVFVSQGLEKAHDTQSAALVRAVTRNEWLLLAAITALAFALRTYHLDTVLFGLHRDEARFGLLAERVLNDPAYRPIYEGMPINQSGFFIYLLAVGFQLWGANVTSLRLVTALSGVLLVPLTWWIAREWLKDGPVALFAAFGLAISSMSLWYSRVAFPYPESTLLAIPAYVFLGRALRDGRWRNYAASGFFLAAAQYASQVSRVALVFAAILVVDEMISRRALPRNLVRGTILATMVGGIVLAPLLAFVVRNPTLYFARTDQVLLLNPQFDFGEYPITLLRQNLTAYAGMFNLAGDNHGGHTLPALPEMDPIFSVLFLVGALFALLHWRETSYRRLLWWLGAAYLPGLITIEAPAPLRVLEGLASAMILAGVGGVWLWRLVASWSLSTRPARARLANASAVLVLLAALGVNWKVYFVDAGSDARLWRGAQVLSTPLGEELGRLQNDGTLAPHRTLYGPDWLVTPGDDRDVLQFLVHGQLVLSPLPDTAASLQPGSLLVRPNVAGYGRLLAARDPRYSSTRDESVRQDQVTEAKIESLLQNDVSAVDQMQGPNFPASNEPTFWLYRVK